MNILIVHSSKSFAGGERVSENIINGIKSSEKNVNFFLACPNENIIFQEKVKDNLNNILLLEFFNLSIIQFILNIKTIITSFLFIKRNKIDLIHTVDPVGFRIFALLGYITNTKVIFHHHYPYSKSAILWFFKRLPKPIAHVFCCESIYLKNRQTFEQVTPEANVKIIHNCIDVEQFKYSYTDFNEVCNICILGNLQPRKGHETFLEMASILAKENSNFKFYIFGEAPPKSQRKNELKAYAKKLGIEKSVYFQGFVSDVNEALSDMHFLICASVEEAFPMNILEGMAIGTVVVSTNVDGIPEAINSGTNGFLTSIKQPNVMAQVVIKLINDPDMRRTVADNARNSVESKFNLNSFHSKFFDFYRDCLK